MARTDGAADGPLERLLFFAVPGALQGLALWALVEASDMAAPLQFSLALLLFATPLAYFLSTTGARRLEPALFALALGGGIAVLAYLSQLGRVDTISGGDGGISPCAAVVSGVGAVLISYIALPFYRTVRERREAPNHYPSLFEFAWSLPVIVVTAGLFVGVAWLVLLLIGGLFNVIGISALADLYREAWFAMPFTYAAGALGIAVVRQREGVVLAMRGIILALLSVLAPFYAVATAIFSVALLIQGIDSLWDEVSPVGVLSSATIAGVVFLNGVLRDEGNIENSWLRWSVRIIAVVIVIFAALSVYGLWLRLGMEGLTPARIIAVIIVALLGLYTICYVLAVGMGGRWGIARQGNVLLAGVVMATAIYLQTPLFQPERWTVQSQTARVLAENIISIQDINLFAFELGVPGRDALEQFADDDNFSDERNRDQIRSALAADTRYGWDDRFVEEERQSAWALAVQEGRVVTTPTDAAPLSARAASASERAIGLAQATVENPVLLLRPETKQDDLFVLVRQSEDTLMRRVMVRNHNMPVDNEIWSVLVRSDVTFDNVDVAKAAFGRIKERGVTVAPRVVPVVTIGGDAISPYETRYERSVPPYLLEMDPVPSQTQSDQ